METSHSSEDALQSSHNFQISNTLLSFQSNPVVLESVVSQHEISQQSAESNSHISVPPQVESSLSSKELVTPSQSAPVSLAQNSEELLLLFNSGITQIFITGDVECKIFLQI